MNALPKFNIKNIDLSDEQLNEKMAESARKESKFFKPGRHATKISKVEYLGQGADETWAKFRLTYSGTGEKQITDIIMAPTTGKLTVTDKNGEESPLPMARLKNFLEALGETVSVATLGNIVPVYFGSETALLGMNIDINAGYAGTHLTKVGENQIALVYRSGDRVDNHPVFSSFEEGRKYCEANRIRTKDFTDVLSYSPSAAGNNPAKKDDNW